jgi:preprotein translocase subunit SecY
MDKAIVIVVHKDCMKQIENILLLTFRILLVIVSLFHGTEIVMWLSQLR